MADFMTSQYIFSNMTLFFYLKSRSKKYERYFLNDLPVNLIVFLDQVPYPIAEADNF